jgi:hypothetical protein
MPRRRASVADRGGQRVGGAAGEHDAGLQVEELSCIVVGDAWEVVDVLDRPGVPCPHAAGGLGCRVARDSEDGAL